MSKFRIGQKVICVDEPSGPVCHEWTEFPKRGQIYTIRGYLKSDGPSASVWLYEIRSRLYLGIEVGFWESRFRPIVTRETDISCFKILLAPKELVK